LCYLIAAFIILCVVVFFAELSFVENLRVHEEEPQSVRNVPCPTSGQDRMAFTLPLESSMTNVYEILQKRKKHELQLEKSTRELWWYLRNHLKIANLSATQRSVREQYISLQWKYDQLSNIGSGSSPFQLNWKYWQSNISVELSSIMKKRLYHLQNPVDCKSAKKLVCRVSKSCGFGCQIHHVSFCFILAYATKRALILDSTNWRYSPNGWNAVFKPVSSTCDEVPQGIQIVYGSDPLISEASFLYSAKCCRV
jgi:hypothetical protein